MQIHKHRMIPIAGMLVLAMIGCNGNENARLAHMAEEHAQRQAAQSQQMVELQQEVARGTRELVEADARARAEMIEVQRAVHVERAKIGLQRDAMEAERRTNAIDRHRDPIIAAAVLNVGLLLACLLPLVLCWYLLRQPSQPTDDNLVAEVLLGDLVASHPLLLAPK